MFSFWKELFAIPMHFRILASNFPRYSHVCTRFILISPICRLCLQLFFLLAKIVPFFLECLVIYFFPLSCRGLSICYLNILSQFAPTRCHLIFLEFCPPICNSHKNLVSTELHRSILKKISVGNMSPYSLHVYVFCTSFSISIHWCCSQ